MAIVKFYRGHPNPPKTTRKAKLGVNAIITCKGKLLLEKRRDCDMWGMIGGGVKKKETEIDAIVREVYEEIGLRVSKDKFQRVAVYGEPGRIAAYQDGSIWRMVNVIYKLELDEEPELIISEESNELHFFSKEELKDLEIIVTHSDTIEDWFLNTPL